MLTAIVAVTLVVPDPAAVEAVYSKWLHYRAVERGMVSPALARAWAAPKAAGRAYVVLQPASGNPVFLRLVQSAEREATPAMQTHGWNANEILVQDTDAVAASLAGSPFRIIGPPAGLDGNPEIRAMQVTGAAGELVYLTRIPPEGASLIRTPAKSPIDRTFIVVVGGPSMKALRAFYGDVLKHEVTQPVPVLIRTIQKAHGLPADHRTPLALVSISGQFAIELDEYPARATPRPRTSGDLSTGMAMVTFAASSLATEQAKAVPWAVPPGEFSGLPYPAKRSALIEGPAGELIEVVEAPDATALLR